MSKCTDKDDDQGCQQHPETCSNPNCKKHN